MFDRGKLIIILLSAVVVLYTVVGGFLGKAIAEDETFKNLSIFQDILKKISREYVEHPEMTHLKHGALEGLVQGTDFFSSFLSPEEYRFVRERMTAVGETGLILSPRTGYYRIMQVLPGTPAAKAGLLPGEIIEEVDDVGISEKTYIYTQAFLRGQPGSSVKLGISRGREEELFEVTLKRAPLVAVPVETKILRPGIGYLRLLQIHSASLPEVEKGLKTLVNSDVKKLVLDLRGCSNGEPAAAITIADMLIDEGIITTQKGQSIADTTFTASPEKTLFQGPIAVLTNGYTNGAAEIIAAALRERSDGTVIGQKTYGTASEQKYFELEDGSAIYLTYLIYHSPAGDPIMAEKFSNSGVKPEVKSPEEDFALSLYIDYEMATGDEAQEFYKKYIDTVYQRQLEKAVEVLETDAQPIEKTA
ncbi:MAG: PDZ domain-containing protein [Acidobacteria bacterium]|nr:PDZ domain-containing protein [Acidobacteriota bacterium]